MKSEFFYCSVFKAPTYRSGANSTNISGGDPYFLWPPPKKWTKSNNFQFLICSKNISPQIHKKNHKIYTTISYKAGAHLGGGQWWQGPTLACLKWEMGACLRSLQQWSVPKITNFLDPRNIIWPTFTQLITNITSHSFLLLKFICLQL